MTSSAAENPGRGCHSPCEFGFVSLGSLGISSGSEIFKSCGMYGSEIPSVNG